MKVKFIFQRGKTRVMRIVAAGAGLLSLLASCAAPPAALPAVVLREPVAATTEPAGAPATPTAKLQMKAVATPVINPVPVQETAGKVTLWHSWEGPDWPILKQAVARFKKRFPGVQLEVEYIPFDDLPEKYKSAAAQGSGPTILLGSSTWGPELYDAGLIQELPKNTFTKILDRIENPALETVRRRGAWIGLPWSYKQGVVLLRNRSLIPDTAFSLEELLETAQSHTRGDVVGAVFDLGFYYSGAHMAGCNGRWTDAQGNPLFDNQTGYCWVDLLTGIQEAGVPVVFNTDQDLLRFREGRTALIIDGSWNIDAIVESIGADNLAIDPWPMTEKGRLSGFFETENLFLNAHLEPEDVAANEAFLRFMLSRSTQGLLAKGSPGSVLPAVKGIKLDDRLQQELTAAFSGGTPLPGRLQMDYYWAPLDQALKAIFLANIPKEDALQRAANRIQISIKQLAEGD